MGPLFDPTQFFPDFDPAVFEQHSDWLYPNHADKATGRIIASMHSWLIETPHHKMLVDTCIGNDKDRMPYRDWHQMKSPWPDNLAATGVTPEEIDFVMYTHLHVDHVGWNTRLDNGQWVPTFPNAKYIFAKTEYEFWKTEREHVDPDTFGAVNNQTFDDSVVPTRGLENHRETLLIRPDRADFLVVPGVLEVLLDGFLECEAVGLVLSVAGGEYRAQDLTDGLAVTPQQVIDPTEFLLGLPLGGSTVARVAPSLPVELNPPPLSALAPEDGSECSARHCCPFRHHLRFA